MGSIQLKEKVGLHGPEPKLNTFNNVTAATVLSCLGPGPVLDSLPASTWLLFYDVATAWKGL